YPVAESVLQDAVLQLYVHNCQITVHEGRHTYHYCIFFKWHCRLRANAMLDKFQGDVVVMKIGTWVSSVVNMHACDIAIADYIVSCFTQRISHLARKGRLLHSVTFVKP
ncbi:hypothetical protein EDC04DRAFT_2927035, partial [Pisolithus marmoratus]